MGATSGPDYKVRKKIYEIEIDGETYSVRKPLYHQHRDMVASMKKAGDEGAVDVTLDNLIALGLPKDAPEKLDIDDILEISKIVLGSKKN